MVSYSLPSSVFQGARFTLMLMSRGDEGEVAERRGYSPCLPTTAGQMLRTDTPESLHAGSRDPFG